jgi:CubicO group peptidase (beta-lactamase class C family)
MHRNRLRPRALFTAGLLAVLCPSAPATLHAQTEPFPGLDAYVERAMKDWDVPGLSLALVRNDTVVFARGYGVREEGRPERVDENTVFAAASLTKSFTAAAAGILVDRGKLAWDTRVAELLPTFTLRDPWLTEHLTLRDLLTHRTGVERGDWLRHSGQNDRSGVLRRMRYLGSDAQFRGAYLYSSLMYLVAGEAIAARAGIPWDEFVRRELFAPLGMERSTTSVCQLPALGNLATPHERIGEAARPVVRLNLDNGAPAGSINTSAADMARWIRMELAGGVYGGRRIVSDTSLAEMHAIQLPMRIRKTTPDWYPGIRFLGYGMGWVVQDYRGEKLLRHSGWIDGFRSEVALLPGKGFGLVVLTNRGGDNNISDALRNHIVDRVLGAEPRDWSAQYLGQARDARRAQDEAKRQMYAARAAGTRPALPLAAYTGTYTDSLYGTAVVSQKNGALTVWLGPRNTARMTHWQGDSFLAPWDNPAYGEDVVKFTVGGGRATQMESNGLMFRRSSDLTATEPFATPTLRCGRA